MIRIDTYLDTVIGEKILNQNKQERSNHKSSRKLSASMLGQPLQWQVLKFLNVPAKETDEYTVRKFLRGKQIEDWLISEMHCVEEKQKFVEYRDVIGYVDAMVDTAGNDFNVGIIPHEVKSVSNAKYKRITQQKGADKGHLLQAGLYALATESKHFAIDYVATDDLRVITYVIDTDDVRNEIEEIIDRYNKQIHKQVIPKFEAVEEWQANEKYCNYPDWLVLDKEMTFEEYNSLMNKI